jgi:hypothetical protein
MDDIRNLCDVAQPRCDDVVIAAAAFGPNAAGRRELSTLRGMSQRQMLKSRGAYLADRVLLAVTPLEVIAMALGPVSSRFREVLRWRRDAMLVRAIESNVGAGRACRPAFLIAGLGAPRLELAPLGGDENTNSVLRLLFRIDNHPGIRS